ncbi:alpha/beta family hydrolase [Marinomonas algarum]|uniref:Dienelactone hydrolase family protein n=1 Tax=Marinomonas algarum TaxID=2883105 RepID=A0A9X1IJ94_9GAMM|nr:alpha/beta family hydrolase [Marinomonas algarum]MCB5160327.1 dienelactone hydrolase family protein [Marinomonas algarum]
MISMPFYLAHGAGAGHSSSFLQQLNRALLSSGIESVIPMTFDYMKQQEAMGKKRPPPAFAKLIPEYEAVISKQKKSCVVSGKSMGGRVASQLSACPMVKAVVCFGFPFHPAGKTEKHRLAFLQALQVPCLIVQGTRDRLGGFEWVSQQSISHLVEIVWVEGADHDFNVLKKYNRNQDDVVNEIAATVVKWLQNAL